METKTDSGRVATLFHPGSIIRARSRPWRVDGQEGNVLTATVIDGGEAEPVRFYVPFESIRSPFEEPAHHSTSVKMAPPTRSWVDGAVVCISY